MEKKPKYKKVTRKADRLLEGKVIARQGKQKDQKLKPYLVLQYLLKYRQRQSGNAREGSISRDSFADCSRYF